VAALLISVIVPCRNERYYIAECVESIIANDHGSNGLEVLVVDGMSDDGTRAVLKECTKRWPTLICLDNPARTTPAALNIGIRRARGQIVIRMDAHCRYPVNYISSLVRWLEQSGADNVGGMCRTLPGSDALIARAIAVTLSHPIGVGNSHFRIGTSTPKWVDTVPFGCYRRSVFDWIGLFDEELVKNQDDEFNQRLIKNGGRILLVPDIIVDYYARDSIGKVARMYYQYGYFKPLVARKLGRVGTLRQAVPATFVLSLAITLLFASWMMWARWAFIGILGAYLVIILGVVLSSLARNGAGVSGLLAVTIPVVHLSYGLGSLSGMFHFLLRRLPGPRNAAEVHISR
jgi:glycosyltransferase involved in cell wall biosynthesis